MRTSLVLALVAVAGVARAEIDVLDRLDRALTVESPGGLVRADLSGLLDLEGYYIDQRPPGLIFGGNSGFVNPRLTLYLDTRVGKHLYGFVEARFDRGFDPRERSASARLDAYLVRWMPLDTPLVNLQFGKFATVIGNWAPRHDSWTNPFVTAPLPYENVTVITDEAAPTTLPAFLARWKLADRKPYWVPLVWGPDYATGGSIFGCIGRFEYAAEAKNAALSARPEDWDARHRGFDAPTASGRLGWRPTAAWAFGVSGSSGPYLRENAARSLAPGQDVGDFLETVVGADLSYAWRHLQVWAEFLAGRFEVPIARPARTVDADTAAYYLEGRYKLAPALFAALRWNQQFFGDVPDGRGGERAWDRNAWRVDTALGYRFDRHLQAKLQYSVGQQAGHVQQGEQLVAAQVTLKF